MLFILLFALITVVILGIGICFYVRDSWRWHLDGFGLRVVGAIMLVSLITMGFIAYVENTKKDANMQSYTLHYNTMMHQLNENYYNKLIYDGRAELIKEIEEYNNTVINGRVWHNNAWFGVFFPMDYERLPLIEFNS